MHEGKLIRRVARFRQMYLSEFEGQSLVERRLGGSNVCEGGLRSASLYGLQRAWQAGIGHRPRIYNSTQRR